MIMEMHLIFYHKHPKKMKKMKKLKEMMMKMKMMKKLIMYCWHRNGIKEAKEI